MSSDLIPLGSVDTPLRVIVSPDLPAVLPFVSMCQTGDLKGVRELLADGEKPVADADGVTPLHWAAINNHVAIAALMVEYFPVDTRGGDLNGTPLHWAARYGLVLMAHFLIDKGADPGLCDNQGFNALFLAVHLLNPYLVAYLLCATGVDANGVDPHGRTPLGWAAYQGDTLTVQALIKLGADVTKADNEGFTPLHWSFMRGTQRIMELLLQEGADATVATHDGKDPFRVAADMNCLEAFQRALHNSFRAADGTRQQVWDRRTGEWVVALAPYVLLPAELHLLDFSRGNEVPRLAAAVALFAATIFLLDRWVVPQFQRGPNAWVKTPFFAGLFSASGVLVVLVTVTSGFSVAPLSTLLFSLTAGAVFYTFYKSVVLNPGYVPPETNPKAAVAELALTLQLDSDHFDLRTLQRIPLRARYSLSNKRLVARFDHWCPWVYNEVGIRNHKPFYVFSVSLWLALVLFFGISYHRFAAIDAGLCTRLPDPWCGALYDLPFTLNLMVWSAIQFVWLTFLVVGQSWNIAKGRTTAEAMDLQHSRPHGCWGQMSNTLGITLFVLTARDMVASESVQFSTMTNVRDFWWGGEGWRGWYYIPIGGEGRWGGINVDYYRLWERPETV